MPEAICDTSPLQYLHQLERLEMLHLLIGPVIIPPAVVDELAVGRSLGINLPDPNQLDWIEALGFHLDAHTKAIVLDLAGEAR